MSEKRTTQNKAEEFTMTLRVLPLDFNIEGDLPMGTKIQDESIDTTRPIRDLLTSINYKVDANILESLFTNVTVVKEDSGMTIQLKGSNKTQMTKAQKIVQENTTKWKTRKHKTTTGTREMKDTKEWEEGQRKEPQTNTRLDYITSNPLLVMGGKNKNG